MKEFSKYVGLDLHKDSIAVADGSDGEVRYHGEIPNSEEAIRKLLRQLGREDMKELQRKARQQFLVFLLRHNKRYAGKTH